MDNPHGDARTVQGALFTDGSFASPGLLQAILDASPDIVVVKDAELRYRLANAAFLAFVGRSESEVVGSSDFDLFPAADAEQYRADDRRVLATGEPLSRDECVSGADGQRWLQVTKSPLRGPAGDDAGVLVMVRDITERKRLERDLTERNARLQTVLDTVPVMITFYDARTQVTHLNRCCEETLGWSTRDANAIDLMSAIYPDPACRREVEAYMAAPSLEWRQFELRTRDGRRLVSAWSNVALEDGGNVGIGIDLRERLAMESALRASEQRLRLITEAIDDVFWMVTPGFGETLYVSPAYTRIWGRACEDVYREPRSFLEGIHRDDREAVATAIERAHTLGTAYVNEYRVVDGDGAVRWVRDRGFPVHAGDGRLYAFAGVGTDVTELKNSEAAIRRLARTLEQRVHQRTAALEAATRELESFSYSVAHDLRAPLRAINGYAEILQEEAAALLDAEANRLLQRIGATTVRMNQLIDGLLTLSRTSRASLEPVTVQLSPLVREIADELEAGAPQRRVEWHIAPDLSEFGDPALLRVLLQNLLHNAWKFTARREPARIEFGRTDTTTCGVFFVRDNGAGFAMQDADKLFQPFQRLHGADYAGSGIGLATVRRIVDRHGGKVWAEAEPGVGATFYFSLCCERPL